MFFPWTGAVAILLLLAVALLCSYELCAVYVTAGSRASERYSPSGFFFGISAIALAINMLFICRMVFNGSYHQTISSNFALFFWTDIYVLHSVSNIFLLVQEMD